MSGDNTFELKVPHLAQDEKWSMASFCVYSDTLPPDAITTTLGLSPTKVHLKGTPKARTRLLWAHSVWILDCPLNSSEPLNKHLDWLLKTMEGKREAVQRLAKKCKILLFCSFSSGNGQGGFRLEPSTISAISDLGIPLSLDLWPPEPGIDAHRGRHPMPASAKSAREASS